MGRKIYLKICLLIFSIFVFIGCKGSETRKTIDSTVDEFTGYRAVKQGEKMKQEIGDINRKQEERFKGFEKQE